jgi:hypothetical protein
MCYALIRVSYSGESGTPETLACDSEEHLQAKVKEVQSRSQVHRIGVFKCDYHIERVEEWRSSPYRAPEKQT